MKPTLKLIMRNLEGSVHFEQTFNTTGEVLNKIDQLKDQFNEYSVLVDEKVVINNAKTVDLKKEII